MSFNRSITHKFRQFLPLGWILTSLQSLQASGYAFKIWVQVLFAEYIKLRHKAPQQPCLIQFLPFGRESWEKVVCSAFWAGCNLLCGGVCVLAVEKFWLYPVWGGEWSLISCLRGGKGAFTLNTWSRKQPKYACLLNSIYDHKRNKSFIAQCHVHM